MTAENVAYDREDDEDERAIVSTFDGGGSRLSETLQFSLANLLGFLCHNGLFLLPAHHTPSASIYVHYNIFMLSTFITNLYS